MRIRLLLLAICLMTSTIMFSQTIEHVKPPYPDEVNVGAVDVERDGQTLVVFYSVRFGTKIRWCDIALYQSIDGGKTFTNISSSDYLSGDIGRIYEGGDKKIYYNISNNKEQLADKQLVFKVEVLKKHVNERKYMILGSASVYPVLSYGAMVATVNKVGFYVKARINMKDFNSYSQGYIDGTVGDQREIMVTTGKEFKERFMITGGLMCKVNKHIYPYLGAGNGFKNTFWEYYSYEGNRWAHIGELSYSGLTLDAGCIFKFGTFVISTAVCNTAFKYTEGEIGIGFSF